MKKLGCSILFVMTILLCACADVGVKKDTEYSTPMQDGSKIDSLLSSSEKKMEQLVTKVYSDDKLKEIANLRLSSIDDVNEAYPIECFRKIIDGYYRAAYVGKDSVVILEFDKTGFCYAGISYKLQNSKQDFDNIKIGDTLDTVRTLDPYGDYPFLYYSNPDFPDASTHCTTDGYYITIQYGLSADWHYVVKEIFVEYI